jgi:aryl-alcohol dehydrogenase-like predicted oxidoreductase
LAGVLDNPVAATRFTEDHLAKHRPQLVRYEALCKSLGLPPAQVALAWLLSRPGLTCPVVGPHSIADLDGAIGALSIELSAEMLAELDSIFPGYQTAPEDYAW